MLKVYLSSRIFFKFTTLIFIPNQMKIFTSILVFLALSLIVFNITLLDFSNLMQGDSLVALIGIAASFCAILILLIFRMSKIIAEKTSR